MMTKSSVSKARLIVAGCVLVILLALISQRQSDQTEADQTVTTAEGVAGEENEVS
jgi:hypothetical protein